MSLIPAQDRRATISSGPIDYIKEAPILPLCAVPTITDEFMNNHMARMKSEYPDVYDRMQIPPVRYKSENVGDIQKFWVMVDDGSGGMKSEEVVAEMLAKGSHTAIWADTVELSSSSNISASLAADYLKLLEESTPAGSRDPSKGVYDLELEYFGSPPNYDGDGIVDFLFADIYSGAGGYFTGQDQTTQSGSNQRDIVYLDTHSSVSYVKGTLSHELQHLIHYNYDKYETVQFNEGLSEMATIVCGGDYISHGHYLNQADQIGWAWESDAAHYAMASLFTVYYVEQFGDGAIKEFIQLQSNGEAINSWAAFDRLLFNHSVEQTHRSWLIDWFTANYLDNKSINSKYGYDLWLPTRARSTAKYVTGNIESIGNTLLNYSPNYIEYQSSADSLEITFTSTSSWIPHYRSIEFNDSSAVVNTLSNGVKHLVYHEDSLKVRSAIFVVVNQQSVDMKYDYVSTGTDASGWTDFVEIAYDDNEIDLVTTSDGGSFGFLGWGNNYTDPSWSQKWSGWAVGFDPKMAINQLVELKLIMGFDQEFTGSTTPSYADKDFYIHFWEKSDDLGNVKDIMPPILWSTKRVSLNSDWTQIDLTPYKDQLSNLGPIVVGIVEDDSVGTYFAMDKQENGENYTYAYNYNGSGRLDPLQSFSVGGTSLDGYNYMFRTSFFIADITVPSMKAGFMQNPVFTDELNLFIIGNSIMGTDNMVVTAKNDGFESILSTETLAGNDSILVTENYRLHSTGTLEITAKGTFLYGSDNIDTTFTYNVNYTQAKIGGDIVSHDQSYIMKIPENSLSESGYVVVGKNVFTNETQKMIAGLSEQIGPIYTVSPMGTTLEKGALISIGIGSSNPSEVSIGYWDGNVWRELISNVSEDRKRIEGIGTHMGHYTLMEKGSGMPLALDQNLLIPTEYALFQNYPNPFNPETTIHYDLPETEFVTLVIYDILGRELVTLVNKTQPAGRYQIVWDGNNAQDTPAVSGIYFYRILTNGYSQTKKMVLSR